MWHCIKTEIQGQPVYSCIDDNGTQELYTGLPKGAKLYKSPMDWLEHAFHKTVLNEEIDRLELS